MTKLKRWLCQRFLPDWCRGGMMEDNARLAKVIAEQRQEISRLNAYIRGLETAMRNRQRIIIRNEVKKE